MYIHVYVLMIVPVVYDVEAYYIRIVLSYCSKAKRQLYTVFFTL